MILLQTSQLNQEEGANTWSWFKPPWSVGAAGQIKATVQGDLVGDKFSTDNGKTRQSVVKQKQENPRSEKSQGSHYGE